MKFQCALITGASSGIGQATAEAFAASGMDLVLLARREARLTEIRAELEKRFKVKVTAAAVDVRDAKQVEAFVVSHADVLARVDVLVNNAGLAKGAEKLFAANTEDLDAMIDTNVKGLLYVTRALVPQLMKQAHAHVVNIGSVAGRWVYPGGATYCASKFAVRALSDGLRMDLLGTGVRVTNIEPGMVETEFSVVRLQDEKKAKAVYQGMKPLTASDIAETILWCLQRPAHVNIQELVVFPTDQASVQLVHRR